MAASRSFLREVSHTLCDECSIDPCGPKHGIGQAHRVPRTYSDLADTGKGGRSFRKAFLTLILPCSSKVKMSTILASTLR